MPGQPRAQQVPDKYAQILSGIAGTGAASGGESSSTNRPAGKYYGVPDDYVYAPEPRTLPRRPGGSMGGAPRAPKYQTASDDDRRILLGLPSEVLADLQDALMEVGLISGKTGYRKGVVDEATRRGFGDLLGYANQQGADWRQALVMYAAAPPVTTDGEGGAEAELGQAGNVTRVTAAADLGVQAEQAAQDRLGRRLKRDETQEFASSYQGMERAQNDRLVAAQQAAQPGPGADGITSEIIDMPSADVAADQFIDSNFAQEAAGQSAYGYFEALKQMLGGR